MAIVKMKQLRLLAMQSDREALLQLLQRMGCVEIDEPAVDQEDAVWAAMRRPEGGQLPALREQKNALEHALGVLKRYAPVKGGLLQSRPVLTREQLYDQADCSAAQQAAEEINRGDKSLSALAVQRDKLTAQRAALAPWLSLDVPLDTPSTREVTIQLGSLPAAVETEQLAGALQQASPLVSLTCVSRDREASYCLLVYHAAAREAVQEVLRDFGWSQASLRGWSGTAKENDERLVRELEQIDRETEQTAARLAGMGDSTQPLRRALDRCTIEIDREEARERLLDTQQTFFLQGWVPEENWPKLRQQLDAYPCAWETADPEREEYPTVPVQLKNNWLTRPLSMVTDMYSLPAYGSVDPNPLMAPFFILFYGFMMADMGYGLVMILAALVVVKKTRPKGPTMRNMFPLLGLCGVSTFIWGALTGGFFGDFLPKLIQMINPNSTFALPALFSPLDDALAVLMGSLALGLIQIFTGMAVSMYRQIKRGELIDALCNEGAWYLVFLCMGAGALTGQWSYALIAALAVIVLTQGHGKKGLGGKLMGIGGSLYNNITGYFSDILSYSRLMALMLAGAVIAQVFNTLGAITGNVLLFFVISMIGNALNFALNLLGCFVHDMRLQCLEYFGRFYEDGGKPFRPLNITTQYVDVVEKQ